MFPVLIRIGPVVLHTYGLMVALGFLAGYAASRVEFRRRGLSDALLERLVFLVMVTGLFGARVLYFVVETGAGLREDPLSFFRIWEGGLVFYGGVLGAVIALAAASRATKTPLLDLTDSFAGPLFLAHALGRIGCFAAGCCYGRPTSSALGVTFTSPDALAPLNVPLLPVQLFEAGGNLALFGVMAWLGRRRPARGLLTASYLAAYGTFRFVMEFFRGDDRGFSAAGLHPSQWIAIGAIAAGLALTLYVQNQKETR